MEEILKYADAINLNKEALSWLNTTGKKYLKKQEVTISELEHILDFFNSSSSPKRLQKMSIKDAKRKTLEWQTSNQKKGKNLKDTKEDIEKFYTFEDGTSIVKLKTKKAYQREGFLMSHCLGGYNPKESEYDIYSYRDKENNPHATFEVRKNSEEIVQIKGKGNGPIHPKYIEPVLLFLEKLGQNIRPSEMSNLGYYYIDDMHIPFLKNKPELFKTLVMIRGKYYAR